MDQQPSDYSVRDLVQSLLGAVNRFVELLAPTLELYESVASEIKITLPVDQGEAVATTGSDEQGSDYVPTHDDLVIRILERWRESGGFVGNGPVEQRQIIAELESLFAPASTPAEFRLSAAVCKAIVDGERLKQLTKDIDDVLITLTDDDKTFDRRRAASRLIMNLIERYLGK